ncbi:M56 family metallopeptidase [Geosporobacter ferrireducens]|uniref:Peptidase M56, BlaR1 n=1 Tax=Geosporobacter ferrireducens TaxID=1424294 RepID=A0A1D8GM62_9FIRM|nr:M56 family metallopeptidase [Geosporobacter ferrireducens]AOT72007.1 peptidase M56, BlaR1 [Geosporobacter ferrireducens]
MNVLQMSVSAGILIFVIVIIRMLAMNKLPKTTFIVLWGIALFRLIIPFSIPSKFSIYHLINRMGEQLVRKAGAANSNEARVLIYHMEAAYKPLQIEAMMILWIAGAVFLTVFFAGSFYKSYSEIRTALPMKGNALIENWLREQKVNRPISILVSDQVTTPLTCGIIKPKIILPKVMDCSNEIQLRYILTHELIHIKRLDALWKLLLVTALCLHWFNPMVWILYVFMNRDLEIACDEKVIKVLGEDTKSQYALSLIQMAECRSRLTPFYSSFSKNATEERIVSIMKFKKTSLFSLVLALIFVVGATLVFAEGTVTKALHIYGVIQTDSGKFNFILDEKGMITVKDEGGNIVSTTTIDSDGNAILTDGSGEIIRTLQLNIPKEFQGKGVRVYTTEILAEKAEPGVRIGISKGARMVKYITEVVGKGVVTVKDAEGIAIATGTADKNGKAILTDDNGVAIGNATVNGGKVMKLIVNLDGMSNKNTGLFEND